MAKKKKDDSNGKLIADNRKARHNYEFVETLEAGIVLTGTEVKSLRNGKAMIAESYATDEGGEIWLINAYIPEYLEGKPQQSQSAPPPQTAAEKDAKWQN